MTTLKRLIGRLVNSIPRYDIETNTFSSNPPKPEPPKK